MSFNTSYFCETGFSAMLLIKNKYRTRLQLEPDLRLKLTKIKPDMIDSVSSDYNFFWPWAGCSHSRLWFLVSASPTVPWAGGHDLIPILSGYLVVETRDGKDFLQPRGEKKIIILLFVSFRIRLFILVSNTNSVIVK